MPHATRPSYLRTLSALVQKDKQRLFIALYPRNSAYNSGGSCDAYHWALIIGSQDDSRKAEGTRYHVAHASTSRFARKASVHAFAYEQNELPTTAQAETILVRITVAKVLDMELVADVLRSLPAPDEGEGDSCLTWVKQAFEALHEEPGCLKSYLKPSDWKDVEICAREYCRMKRRQRRQFDAERTYESDKVSTWNFLENRETTA